MQQVREVKRQATTGESLTLNVLAENLEEHLDEFRGTVVNSVMSLAEEKMDNLGITDAFEEAFRDDAVLGQLKTKLETGLEDTMTFFESGSPFDGIEMVTDQLEPAMDMLTGVCNQTTGRARREAALQQARAEYLQKKENRSAGNSKRTAGVLSDFASPLLTASLGVGLPGWELQLTTNWKAGLSVGGGFSLGVDTANPNQVFTGVGVGVDFSLEKGQKTCAIDADCKAKARRATICEDNKCTRVCSSAASCGPKEACDNLRCVVACDAHYDCVGLQKCDIAGTKRCQPTTACVSDSGCHVGSEVCLDNKRCVPRECTSDAQCTPGTQFCHNHRCLASECTKATEAADCTKAGEICVTRQCVPAAGQPCADAASCGLDAYCNGGLCVDKTPAPGAAMCMSNSDCSVPGETCLSGSGECGIACNNDADCGLDEGLCMFVSGSWRCVAGSSGRRANVVSTEARKGFWKEVGDSVDISLDWYKDALSFSGFAFVVSVSNEYLRNSALHISNLHVTLSHPHWGCLREPGVEGELSMIVTAAAQTVRGKLTAGGWYYEALKIPFVHIGNMFLGMEWDVKSPLPTGFMLGGAVCLGSRENCQNKAQPFVEGRAYVGVSASLPEDNFFVAMVTNLTIGGIAELAAQEVPWLVLLAGEASDEALAVAKAAFAALGVDVSAVTSTLEGIQQALPPQFAASGLYPYSKDYATACPEVDADAVHTTLDMDCYAYLSFSPLKTQDIVLGTSTLTIPKGIALAGRLNFVGWEMAAEVAISTSQFYINATMDPVFIRFGNVDFLRIGSHLDANKEAAGGARFLVDMNILPPRAEVNIQGAFDIPLLKSYGEVALVLDPEKLAFHSEINLFNGALASIADVYFPWDFTAFHMSLSDMEFLYGLVTVKQVKFDYDAAVPHPYAIFDARIDVLFAVGVEAQLKVQDDTLSFAVGLSVLGVTSTISGTAAMDTSNFLDSSFSLSVETDINPAAVVAAVVDVAEDVAQVAKNVWNTVTTAVADAWTFVKAQFDVPPLNYLASTLGPFLDDVGGVLADVGGALMDAGLSDIVSLGHDFAGGDFSALGDAVHNLAGTFGVGGSRNHREVDANEGVNEYGCRLRALTARISRTRTW